MRGVRRAVGLTSVSRTGPERRRERTQTPATTRRHLARVQRNLDLMGWTTTMYLNKRGPSDNVTTVNTPYTWKDWCYILYNVYAKLTEKKYKNTGRRRHPWHQCILDTVDFFSRYCQSFNGIQKKTSSTFMFQGVILKVKSTFGDSIPILFTSYLGFAKGLFTGFTLIRICL